VCCAVFRERKCRLLGGSVGDGIGVYWFSLGDLKLLDNFKVGLAYRNTSSAGDSAHTVRRGYRDAADPARAVAARARDYWLSVKL
jgi:hypothetical protein